MEVVGVWFAASVLFAVVAFCLVSMYQFLVAAVDGTDYYAGCPALRKAIRERWLTARLSWWRCDWPRFTPLHAESVFLGRYHNFDLYYVMPEDNFGRPSLSARFGNHASDYHSGMIFGWIEDVPDHPLVEARKRAEAWDLDVCRELYANKVKSVRAFLLTASQASAGFDPSNN